MVLELNGWIPITNLGAGAMIKGIISCGDEKRLRPMALSLQSSDRYNEFPQQLAISFPARLIAMKPFSSTRRIRAQRIMHHPSPSRRALFKQKFLDENEPVFRELHRR
ncbi:hypothetical protein P170DRAFT_475967 [Aspergillus steynii IBT 23096]|uniref:Uncharacterized protein n=1 Tax=Aspergillus steynii IBT 23096 TaxID=1392250 RepID=A0A2I2G9Y1_9EURO|nr:uncharacterized protein P170DRAFT_475967 [Aspergillus steynii IBT 23096]PLB49675.1 hypothetical protein P170DRAFT_475967 [Aspergillus steynii IBT 23096]